MTWEEAREVAIRQVLSRQATARKDGVLDYVIQSIRPSIVDANIPMEKLIQFAKSALKSAPKPKTKAKSGVWQNGHWSPTKR